MWEVVGREALQQVLGTAEAQARNGAAGALEEDARLTALFLWTMQSTSEDGSPDNEADPDDDESDADDDEAPRRKASGYSLPFDVARRFAQPLGVHLDEWESRIIKTEKGVVRLLPVSERGKQLFGESRRCRRSRRDGRRIECFTPVEPLPGRCAAGAGPGAASG